MFKRFLIFILLCSSVITSMSYARPKDPCNIIEPLAAKNDGVNLSASVNTASPIVDTDGNYNVDFSALVVSDCDMAFIQEYGPAGKWFTVRKKVLGNNKYRHEARNQELGRYKYRYGVARKNNWPTPTPPVRNWSYLNEVIVIKKPNAPGITEFKNTENGQDQNGIFTFKWGAASTPPPITGYQVEQCKGSCGSSGSWGNIYSSTAINKKSIRVPASGSLPNGNYRYRVRSYLKVSSATKYSDWEYSAYLKVDRKPNAVTNFTQPSGGTQSGNFQVAWSAPTGAFDAITQYELQCSRNNDAFVYSNCGGKLITSTSKSTSFTAGTSGSYRFRARAYNAAGWGPWTPPANYKTVSLNIPMPTPSAVSINAPESSDFGDYDITWNALGAVTSYQLQRYCKTGVETCGAEGWHTLQLNNSTAKTYAARGHIADKYRYRVKACNGNSCTGWKTSSWVKVHNLDGIEPAVVLTQGTTPGKMPYSKEITRNGDIFVNLPMEVAPGVNNLQPSVKINYSGARFRQRNTESLPEDYLGYGWRIGGFGSIRRCTVGRPNHEKIMLTEADSICLDGRPLVTVSGHRWANNSTYRAKKENFHLVTLKKDDNKTWFEVRTPDGHIYEYGRTPDSRLKVGKSTHFGWSLNKVTDTFGNAIEYRYHRDTVEGINYPLEISYGNNADARIVFEYGTRSDAPPQPLDANDIQQEQLVLLHHVKVLLDNKLLRKYKLISEDESEIEDYRRLKYVQKCAFDENGNNEQCLNPMAFDWLTPQDNSAIDSKTGISGFTDTLGREVQFKFKTIADNSNNGQFSERPFGNGIAPPNAAPLVADNGKYRSLVSEVWRSSGNANGWHKTKYAYQGTGFISTQRRGFLGYYAQRIHDTSSDIVTYRQFRLDYPYIGNVAREVQYIGLYPGSGEILSKSQNRFGSLDLSTGQNSSKSIYVKQSLEWVFESGQTLGYKFSINTPQKASYGDYGELISSMTKTGRFGLNANAPTDQNFWGEVKPVSVTGIKRSVEALTSFENNTTDWVIGFKEAEQLSQYDGPLSVAPDIVKNAVYTRYGTTKKVESITLFPNDSQYENTITFSYDSNGNIATETVLGVNVPERVSTVNAYLDKRYPTTLTNALEQVSTVNYDQRFGLPKSVKFNNQTTQIKYDNFGREVKTTNSDGVGFTTTRQFCPAGVCPIYGNQSASYQITTDSPITPSSTSYYDILGRIIQQDTQGFDGVATTRREFNYDSLGRLYLETLPFYVGDEKQLITYQFDTRNRVSRIDRPDGSQVRTTYTPTGSAGRFTITNEQDVLNGNGDFLETQVKTSTLDFLGDLLLTVDAVGTSERTATKYTYNGAGLLTSVLVDNNTSTKTIFDYDSAGFQSSIDSPDAGLVTNLYNALGQLVSQTDNSGQSVVISYDKLGRLRFKEDDEGIAEWAYDPVNGIGALGTRTYTTGGAQVFKEVNSYNSAAKRVTSDTTLKAGGLTRSYARSFTYDTRGRAASATDPAGSAVHYEYNGRGYLQKLTDGTNTLKTFTSVDAFGKATQENYGNGVATTKTYNPDTGRLEAIVSTGAQEIQNNAYNWRSNGTLESRTASGGGSATKRELFSYDGLNRLETAQTWLDGANQRTLTTLFDRLGNIQGKTSSIANDNQVTGYQYGQTANAGAHAVTSATIDGTAHTFHYNQNGAVTRYDAASGDDKWITWNARQLPTEIVVGSSKTTPTARDRFRYGPDGQRFYRESSYWDESQQQLITDKTFIIGEFEDYLPGNDPDYRRIQKTAVDSNVIVFAITDHAGLTMNTVEYVHRDHLGSVEKITDADGNLLIGALAFDPYGARKSDDWSGSISDSELAEILAAQGLSTNRGFTNHEQLDRTGLIHMNGRIYDPVLGRFLSPDPIVQAPTFSQSWNRYSYIMNSPLSGTDPSGFVSMMEEVEVYCDASCGGGGLSGFEMSMLRSLLDSTNWVNFGGAGGAFGGPVNAPLTQEEKDEKEAEEQAEQHQEIEEVVKEADCDDYARAGMPCRPNQRGSTHTLNWGQDPYSDPIVREAASSAYRKAAAYCKGKQACKVTQEIKHINSSDVEKQELYINSLNALMVAFPTGLASGFISGVLKTGLVKSTAIGTASGLAMTQTKIGFSSMKAGDIHIITSSFYHDGMRSSKSLTGNINVNIIGKAD
ncbi:RHS repeat-associated core domain-containing protein [Microbulbifer sp. 2304DJ12-6]|uniref:RHS repeat-associated core domain-containing protein n=1 Tax=Microbulbifer sp. 2304DJ12-6 TaxID=3233340 RepID=UPI0039B08BDA